MSIFEQKEYREVLRTSLLVKKEQHGRPFTFQTMATACRVQKAYLSKVLRGQGHLSDDQLYLAAEFLKFTPGEREYVTLLHAQERCTVPARSRDLAARIDNVRRQNLQTDAHLTAKPVAGVSSEIYEYYLDPTMQLLHMFLSIDRYAKEPDRIGRELGLTKLQMADKLDRLLKLGIVSYGAGRYKIERDNLHLPAGSKVYDTYRTLMRLKALEQVPRTAPGDTYNFSAVFSADDVTRSAIQARILDMIRATEGLVLKSPQEKVFQITINLFK